MEAKTKDGHTTVTMTDTEADELFWELQHLGEDEIDGDAIWKMFSAMQEDGRESEAA